MAVKYFQRPLQFSINLFQVPTFFSRWWEVVMTTYSVLRPICMNRFIFLVLGCWSWCRHWLMDFQPTNPCTLLSFGKSISKETHWNLHVFLPLIRLSFQTLFSSPSPHVSFPVLPFHDHPPSFLMYHSLEAPTPTSRHRMFWNIFQKSEADTMLSALTSECAPGLHSLETTQSVPDKAKVRAQPDLVMNSSKGEPCWRWWCRLIWTVTILDTKERGCLCGWGRGVEKNDRLADARVSR